MEVHMLADMEVDKVADKVVNMTQFGKFVFLPNWVPSKKFFLFLFVGRHIWGCFDKIFAKRKFTNISSGFSSA